MFRLSKKTKKTIEKITGINADSISSMEHDEIQDLIEQKINKKLEIKPSNDPRLTGRGSVYLYLRRLMSMKDADEVLSKI